jgi:hypothetical protein
MELIEVAELCRGKDPGTVVVAHSQTSLQRGLELGEEVVLATGEHFHSARVRDIDFELDDTVYTLDLGGRLPADLARERAEGLDPERHDIEMHELIDLLGDLRHLGTVDPTRTHGDSHRDRLAPV